MPIASTKLRCNHAYVDATNLDKGTSKSAWRVDYHKFYIWLKEKHHIKRAYIFIGYIPRYDNLYARMREAGFLVRFKDTVNDKDGHVKGNCDADLVLRSVRDVHESVFEKAIIVSSDGDFGSLVSFLQEKEKMDRVISPNKDCSILIMRTGVPVTYLNDIREFISLS